LRNFDICNLLMSTIHLDVEILIHRVIKSLIATKFETFLQLLILNIVQFFM